MLLRPGDIVGLLIQHTNAIFRAGISKICGLLIASIGLSFVKSLAELSKLEPLGLNIEGLWMNLARQVRYNIDGIDSEFVLDPWGGWTRIVGIVASCGLGDDFNPVQHVASPRNLHRDILRAQDMLARIP
jgi:hypothetical protein